MNPLDSWLAAAAAEIGVPAETMDRDLLLELTRDVAHGVARPAAPLTSYLVGVAVGLAGGDPARLREAAARLSALAADWSSPAADIRVPGDFGG